MLHEPTRAPDRIEPVTRGGALRTATPPAERDRRVLDLLGLVDRAEAAPVGTPVERR